MNKAQDRLYADNQFDIEKVVANGNELFDMLNRKLKSLLVLTN